MTRVTSMLVTWWPRWKSWNKELVSFTTTSLTQLEKKNKVSKPCKRLKESDPSFSGWNRTLEVIPTVQVSILPSRVNSKVDKVGIYVAYTAVIVYALGAKSRDDTFFPLSSSRYRDFKIPIIDWGRRSHSIGTPEELSEAWVSLLIIGSRGSVQHMAITIAVFYTKATLHVVGEIKHCRYTYSQPRRDAVQGIASGNKHKLYVYGASFNPS